MTPPGRIPLLIVEDNPMYAEILQRLLPTLGTELQFQVTWVDTAEKALAQLDRQRHELMLLDYKLPGADGLAVLAQVRGLPAEKQPAVIMLTGMGNEAVAVEAMKAGAKDYLAKDHLDVPSLLRAISSALERKRLESELARSTRELREKNEQMRADLQIAGEIQQALLPQDFPRFPAGATEAENALRFLRRYRPTGAVGGDFFDVFPVSPTQAGVFLCDVMGHGVRAALVTAIIRALVEEHHALTGDPSRFLTTLNHRLLAILKQTRMPMFASGFFLIADLAAAEIRFANAGHPAPLHLRRRAGELSPLTGKAFPPGPALGVFEDSEYATYSQPLAAQDLIVFYTDGLFEVEGADGELYGPERLHAAFRQRLDLPPDQLFDEILAEVAAFGAGTGFTDDVCLLGLDVQRVGL
jgi:sigma-B regulation protein RsbU (phosphoserine phosphatase)